MKTFISVLLMLTICSATKAQTVDSTTFYANSNFVYGNLDKAKITTGILREYGIDFINQDNFNGKVLHDSNWANLTDWRVLYASLYSQQISSPANMLYLDVINTRMSQASQINMPITLVGLDYYFQGLDTNAVNRGLIRIINGRLYDGMPMEAKITPPAPTAYITYEAFAFATTQQTAFTGNNQFIFRSNLFFTNSSKTISELAIDPRGNGNYQTANFDVPITVNYPDTGLIPLTVRVTYTDGSINYSHTKIAVYSGNAAIRYGLRTVLNENKIAEKPYLGILGEGDISIELATSNNTGQIRKPLIVVEGFDPDGSFKYKDPSGISHSWVYDLNFDDNSNSFISLNYDLDDINQYDMIFVNFKNGTDYIQRNAFFLEAVIKNINQRKTTWNGVRQQNVIMGMSMGGLVVRYALRDMELTNVQHETRLFISHDAPHWGANVPVAYQALVQHIAPWKMINVSGTFPTYTISYQDLFPEAVDAKNLFNSPAAKQMLIQRYILASNSMDNSTHLNFMNEIDGMGWPLQCRNVTLSNGACNGTTQFPAGSQLLGIYGSKSLGTYFGGMWRSLLISLGGAFNVGAIATGGTVPINNWAAVVQFPLSLITTKGTFYFDFAAWGVPNSGSSQIYQGDAYIKRQLFWGLFNTTSYLIKCHVNTLAGMLPLDHAPGGVYDLGHFGINTNSINNQLHTSLGDWINATVLQKRFCFVPTVSSLAILNPQQNLFTPLCDNIACLRTAAVSDFYAPTVNQLHISYTQANGDWIINNQNPANVCNKICAHIQGNDFICNSSVYQLDNLPPGYTVNWSVSPNYSVLQLAPNTPGPNQLTITNQHWYGVTNATLTATITPGNCTILTKQISNDNDEANGTQYYWEQPSCYAGNVLHPYEHGTTGGASFVHQGCFVYVAIGEEYTSYQITGGYTPMAHGFGYHVFNENTPYPYSQRCFYFQPQLGSGGIPFQFTFIKGSGGCNRTILFFTYSNNGKLSEEPVNMFTATPNPVNDFVDVKINQALSATEKFQTGTYEVKISELGTSLPVKQFYVTNPGSGFKIDMTRLRSGYYVIEINNGKTKGTLKVFKL